MTVMRAAFVTSESFLGGGETSLLNVSTELGRLGWEPVLFCPAGDLACAASQRGIKVEQILLPDAHLYGGIVPALSLSTVRTLAAGLRRNQIAALHAESLLGLLYGGLAAKLCRIPCVATYHGYWPVTNWALRCFLRSFCSRIYLVSNTVARELECAGLNRRTIPLDFSQDFLKPLPDQQTARLVTGLPQTGRIVMQVGRFQEVKGQMNLFDAAELLLSCGGLDDLLVVLVGGVPGDESCSGCRAYYERVRARAETGRLQGHVVFTGARRDVPLLMKAADVVACPSEHETFGMAVIEANAVGVPVVATDVGGPGEVVRDRDTGLLVPCKDPGELARAIRELLTDQGLARQLADRARARALAKYRPGLRAERLAEEYRILAGSSGVEELRSSGVEELGSQADCGVRNAGCGLRTGESM